MAVVSGGIDLSITGAHRVVYQACERLVALYQAAEQARQWDPQLAHLYWRQMVHRGKTHKQAMGAVMSHLAARVLAVLRQRRPYQLRDEQGRAITRAQARKLILARYVVPEEIRRQRRRRKSNRKAVLQAKGVMVTPRGIGPTTNREAALAPQRGTGPVAPQPQSTLPPRENQRDYPLDTL